MAQITNTVLTDEHYRILNYTYQYYNKNKVGPLYYTLKNDLGISKDDINQLFPQGLHSLYAWVDIPIHSTNNPCKPVPIIKVDNYQEVYLDYNATTHPRKEVVNLLNKYYKDSSSYGNPSSSTKLGKIAYNLIDTARAQIADCLKVKPQEIVFVSGGSEANNLAIKGIAFKHLKTKGHIITNKIEHPSVIQVTRYLEEIGFEVTYLDVDENGFVSPQSIQDCIKEQTILVAIMAANNEIGTINSIEEIGEICRKAKIHFMVDAVQAFGRIALNPKEMGISLLSISGHKIYGPKGIGALFIDENISITPLIHGGKQEFGIRAGTENVGSIVAFGKAAQLICSEMVEENKRLFDLQEFFLTELKKIEPHFIINGPLKNRLPHNLNIGFPNIDSGALLLSLNQIGIYASSGAACSAGSTEKSHVLEAIGVDTDYYGTIRFSFGLHTQKEDLQYLFDYLPYILKNL